MAVINRVLKGQGYRPVFFPRHCTAHAQQQEQQRGCGFQMLGYMCGAAGH